MSNQQMMLQPKQTIMLHGEKWELHKSATDSTIPFAYDRVKVESFACENIDNNVYIILVGGYIAPRPNSLEKPVRILMVGFSNVSVTPMMVNITQLQNMHIYKADTFNMAKDFAKEFFSEENNEGAQAAQITPFPQKVETVQKQEDKQQ